MIFAVEGVDGLTPFKPDKVKSVKISMFKARSNQSRKADKARAVKQKSPADCFEGEWCADGYCKRSLRSASSADAKHMRSCYPHQIKRRSKSSAF